MMKIIFSLLIFVKCLSIFSQENLEIKNLKETLIKDKQLFAFNLNTINEEIRKDSIVLNQLTMENKGYLTDLRILKVSDKNLKVYNSLIQKKLFQPIDFLNKKTKKFSRSLNEQFNLNLLDNYFVENQTLYYYFVDSNYKASILKSIGLDSKNYKNFLRLDIKEVYSPKNMTSNQFLYNLTGINNNYFTLTEKIDSLKAKIKKLNENLIEKGQKKKLTIEEYKTKERVTENKIKLIEQEIKNEIIAQENLKKYPCKSINGVDIYLGPVLEKSFRNGDIIREARTPGEWSDFIKNKIPAYKYEGFDSQNSSKDLIYNYFAFSDKREIAPIGFHKINILDFVHLEGKEIGDSKKVILECYCKDGLEEVYSTCQFCNHWTKKQREVNICSKCNNITRWKSGTKKCSTCNGTRKFTSDECINCKKNQIILIANDFTRLDSILKIDGTSWWAYEFKSPLLKMKIDNDKKLKIDGGYLADKEEILNMGYSFIYCRDRINKISAKNSLRFGELEMMNSFLNVTQFKNGEPIKYIEDNVEWELAIRDGIAAYCYFNNDKTVKNCFYNVHAINDKRGLLPDGWRAITDYDVQYIEFIKNKRFEFSNKIIPLNRPLGYRDNFGKFQYYQSKYIEDEDKIPNINFKDPDFAKNGGYVLCVKEKNLNNFLITDQNLNQWDNNGANHWITISNRNIVNIDNHLKNSQIIEGFKNKTGNQIKNKRWSTQSSINFEGDRIADFYKFYNQDGQEVLKSIFETGWKELFDKNNGKIEFVSIAADLFCDYAQCCGNLDYIYRYGQESTMDAWLLSRTKIDNKFKIDVKIIKVNIKNYSVEIIEDNLIPLNEITYYLPKLNEKVKFNFDVNSCNATDNPIDNFYLNNMTRLSWIDNKVNGAYWTENQTKAFEVLKDQINSSFLKKKIESNITGDNPFDKGGKGKTEEDNFGTDMHHDINSENLTGSNGSGDTKKYKDSGTVEDELKSQSTDRLDPSDFSTKGNRKRGVNLIISSSSIFTARNASELFLTVFRVKEISNEKIGEKETWYKLNNAMLLKHLAANEQAGATSKYADGSYYYVFGIDLQKKEKKEVYDVLLLPKRRLYKIVNGKKSYSDIQNYLQLDIPSLGKIGNSDVISFNDLYDAINPRADIGETLSSREKITGQFLREKFGKILDPNNTAEEGSEQRIADKKALKKKKS